MKQEEKRTIKFSCQLSLESDIFEALKKRAERNQRHINKEVYVIIRKALCKKKPRPVEDKYEAVEEDKSE